MGKIPARGFITWLYSATVPTVSTYIVKSEKKYVNRVKLTAWSIYALFEPHSLAKYEYEFFLEHFIHNNARSPLLFLVPKDNNDVSHHSLIKNFPPYLPPPPLWVAN